MNFKQWLEGITSMAQVQLMPDDGNAQLRRTDIGSKYTAPYAKDDSLPPGDDKKNDIKPPSKDPEDQFGFRNKIPSETINKPRKIVPMRTKQVYT